jgi:hypothetical protein
MAKTPNLHCYMVALIEAYTYMKGEADLIALYTGRYKEAMGQLTGVDIRSDRDEYRNGKV